MLIVVTGAIVRLTGSGLGCPTWPKCTEDSITTVPEMGIHGIIEFGNRLLTFVLAAIGIWALVLFWKTVQRKFAVTLLLGVVAQALLGGVTVLTGLNSWIVGAHYLVSAVLIWIAAKFVWSFYKPQVTPAGAMSRWKPFHRRRCHCHRGRPARGRCRNPAKWLTARTLAALPLLAWLHHPRFGCASAVPRALERHFD